MSTPPRLTPETPFPPDCATLFEPLAPLGRGGFGAVWRARHRTLDRAAAVKLLLDDVLDDPAQVQRFVEEGRITAAIVHPNVVRVLATGAESGVPWIAYELIDGESLRARLARGPLPWAEALECAAQVADALAAAHAAGVVHRDIKPDNVLVSPDGRCTVMDFGIASWARRAGVKTATGLVLGTPAYLAPEQIRGEGALPASDVYAAGAMLFELVTGDPPFGADQPLVVLERHLKSAVPSARARGVPVPEALDAVLARMLAKDAGARPAPAQLGETLRALASGAAGPHAATGPVRPASRPTMPVSRLGSSSPAAVPARGAASRVLAVLSGVALLGLTSALVLRRAPPPDVAPLPSPRPSPLPTAALPAPRPALPAPLAEQLARLDAADRALGRIVATVEDREPRGSGWADAAAKPLEEMIRNYGAFLRALAASDVRGPVLLDEPYRLLLNIEGNLRRYSDAISAAMQPAVEALKRDARAIAGSEPFRAALADAVATLPESSDIQARHRRFLEVIDRGDPAWRASVAGRWCAVSAATRALDISFKYSLFDDSTRAAAESRELLVRVMNEASAFAGALPDDFAADGDSRRKLRDVASCAHGCARDVLDRGGGGDPDTVAATRRALASLRRRLETVAALHPQDRAVRDLQVRLERLLGDREARPKR